LAADGGTSAYATVGRGSQEGIGPSRSRGRAALRIAGILVSLYLGGMLLYAAALKAADPGLFVDQIRGYGIFPSLAPLGAVAFVWVELLLGAALILQVAPRWAHLGTAALMLLFIGVTAYAWSQGNTENCGCFGRLGGRAPRDVILEDTAFVALAGFGFWAARFQREPWIARSRARWGAFAVLGGIAIALPWLAPRLPVDSYVTGIGPGYRIDRLAADDLKVDLGEGPVLVGLLGEGCAPCVEALPMMGELAQADAGPKVVGVFSGDRARKRAWALEHAPAFPLAHAPEKSLRQYYRRLPAFFLAEDGKVTRVWWGRPPAAEEVRRSLGRSRA